MKIRPTELTVLLSATIKARKPVLITGAPGIGKSDIVTQATIAAGADLILSHPAVEDPTDTKGLPWVVDGHARFMPFGDLEKAMNADHPTVWFFDDLGQASPAVQASKMQLLLAREVNGHKIPDEIVFVAATNRRTDKAGVTGILEPVKSRFVTIVELEPNLDDWCNWAIDHDISPVLLSFLRFQPDLLCKFSASADLSNSPVPRTWNHVHELLKMDLPNSVQNAAISGAVGEGAATEFLAFLKLCQQLPSIDQILIDPKSVPVPQQPAILYALAGALANRTTETNFSRVAMYINLMCDDGKGEFGVLTLRDAMRRHPEITQTQAFVKLATGELGALISGS
jgi:hypothetical protein